MINIWGLLLRQFPFIMLGADIVYNRFFTDLMKGTMDLDGAEHTVKCSLMLTGYTPDKDDDTWADISANECSDASYSAQTLANKAVTQDDSGDKAKFDADNVTYTSLTATGAQTPYYAVLWNDTHATDDLILCIDFGGAKPCDGGNFEIIWDAAGILTLAQS